jgi:hypothetical protein
VKSARLPVARGAANVLIVASEGKAAPDCAPNPCARLDSSRRCSMAGARRPPGKGRKPGGGQGVSTRGLRGSPAVSSLGSCLLAARRRWDLGRPNFLKSPKNQPPRNHACPPTAHCNPNFAVVPIRLSAGDTRGDAGARPVGRGPVWRRRLSACLHRRRKYSQLDLVIRKNNLANRL